MGFQKPKYNFFHLLTLVALGLSLLREITPAPVSGTLRLTEHDKYISNGQMFEEEKWEVDTDEQVFRERRDIETHDYPGSGANRGHEPGGG
ncbi:hypothetical protein KI387_038193 [Taxus chinensis]|uniref:Glycine-rich protein n=1 Tax=Taxus chinensis TaxID=29808 RepID=A0AA38C7E3_TAXCH|nr:hypothetical protein KI387_038193 [Taxus chinensis]